MKTNSHLRYLFKGRLIIALFIIWLAGLASDTRAQQAHMPKVIPPSPDASSLGKYGEIPVSLFTGTASVNIPLYDLQSKTLSVPVSLSYHGSGVKVEEIASWVGIGWALNAGGVITRSVRGGFPDEEINGRLNNFLPTPTALADPLTARSYAPGGSMDAEPDAYYYNFNGRSGQLIFSENGAFHTTSAEKIQFGQTILTSGGTSWILTDEQGTKYYFGGGDGVEVTQINGQPVPTAWYLTKIVSADGSDVINFIYTPKEETTYVPASQSYVWHNSDLQSYEEIIPSEELGFQGDYTLGTSVSGYATLSEISSKKGKIVIETTANRTDFSGAKEVDKIKVLDNNGQLLKLFEFSYSLGSQRIFLTSVAEVGSTGIAKPAYVFTYYDQGGLPSRSSKSQDFWGYYNAKSNQHLIPNVPSGFPMPTGLVLADRACDSVAMIKGTLKSITYPTGGRTEFEYGPNQFGNGVEGLAEPSKLPLSTINDEVKVSDAVSSYNQSARITIAFNSFREEDNYPRPVVHLQRFENDAWSTPLGNIWQIPTPSLENTSYDINLTIPIHVPHRIMITTEGCPQPPCNTPLPSPDHYTTEVNFYYFDSSGNGMISDGGGLRVNRITDYDALNPTVPANVRKFEYFDGLLVSFPLYHRTYERWACKAKDPISESCIEAYPIPFYSATSQSLVNLGTSQGGLVVYRKVREIYGENGENGYSESYFTASGDLGYSGMGTNPPFLPRRNTDFFDGKLWKQTRHHQDGHVLKENWSQHVSGGQSINFSTIRGLKVLQTEYPSSYFGPTEGTGYIHGYYNIDSEWVYLDSTRELSYLGGSEPVKVSTKYLYENPVHAQVTNKKTYSSEGKLIEVRSSYAHDAPSETEMNAAIFSELQARNMIGVPLRTETWFNGSRTDGTIVNFSTYPDGTFQTSSFQVLEGTNYKPKIRYHEYANGNIQMASRENDVKISYIWGYNNALPIAEVRNAEIGAMTSNYTPPAHYVGANINTAGTDVPLSPTFTIPFTQNVNPNMTVSAYTPTGGLCAEGCRPPDPLLVVRLKKDGVIQHTFNCTWGTNNIGQLTLGPGEYQWFYDSNITVGGDYAGDDLDITTTYVSQRTGYKSFHTSFEENGVTHAEARTGLKVWSGVYALNLPGYNGDYTLSYWKKTGSNPWQLVEVPVTVTVGSVQTMNIGSSGSVIDEVRVMPVGATMTTYTHDPLNGLASMTDQNNVTIRYEYDDLGRLKTVKDNDNNVMKTYSYHYKQ